jgi:AcrR family transcriptional regulator
VVQEGSDVEQRVLEAARRLFVAQGVAKTPLRAVAAAAGTSESGILRFFQDKNDLVSAVMDLCWVEVDEHMAKALRVSAKRSDDPRAQLMDVVQAVLEHAEADGPTTSFLVSHFHHSLASGFDEDLLVEKPSRLDGFREYRRRIDQLCTRIAEDHPDLGKAGITQAGLCHLTLSLIYGITGAWYMSEHDPDVHGPKVPLEDAMGVLRAVVYRTESIPQRR